MSKIMMSCDSVLVSAATVVFGVAEAGQQISAEESQSLSPTDSTIEYLPIAIWDRHNKKLKHEPFTLTMLQNTRNEHTLNKRK